MPEQNTEMYAMGVTRYSNEKAKSITRDCIETALIQLLEYKDLDKISITEIVKRAGVSRTAFYANYTSKEEVLKVALAYVIEKIIALTPGDPRTSEYWMTLFSETKKYAEPFKLLLKAGLGDQILTEITEKVLVYTSEDTANRYKEILWIGALYNVLVNWVKNGARETVEYMAKLCAQIVNFDVKLI